MSEEVSNRRLSMQDQCNVFALFFSVPQSYLYSPTTN
jgi:hypothetical protein